MDKEKKGKQIVTHKNVELLFYILFTVAGTIGSIVFVNHFESGQDNSLLLRSPASLVSIIPYLIFFLGLILAIYFYWDIFYPNKILVKIICRGSMASLYLGRIKKTEKIKILVKNIRIK